MGGLSDSLFEIEEFLESIFSILNTTSAIFTILAPIFTAVFGFLGTLVSTVFGAVVFIAGVIAFVIGFIISYLICAIPVYSLVKKCNRKSAWMAWIPIFGGLFRSYVLSDIAGDKEFSLFNGKMRFKNRQNVFWIYLCINLLGDTIITVLVSVLSFVPLINVLSPVLFFVPGVCTSFIEFVYLRDVLDIFGEDKNKNRTVSIVITLLDYFLTFLADILLYPY